MTPLTFIETARMSLRAKTNGGILYLLPSILVKIVYLTPLMFLWRAIAGSGIDAGMSLTQMLTYAYVNALLASLLTVRTVASEWNYEGKLIGLFCKPCSVFSYLIADTVGGWLPMLALFTVPMALIAPFLGVSLVPHSLWFFPSLALCVSLGFAMEFLFVCVTIRLRGMSWLAMVIRSAITALFSGAAIPFKLLPFGLTTFFELQPFGSLSGAPLSLFVGTADPARVIIMGVIWNAVVWPAAIIWFKRSQERMVSFGG